MGTGVGVEVMLGVVWDSLGWGRRDGLVDEGMRKTEGRSLYSTGPHSGRPHLADLADLFAVTVHVRSSIIRE